MNNITSLSGALTLPEIKLSGGITLPEVKLNFVVHMNNGEGPKGCEAKAMGRILDMASGLPPEMQELIAKFADFLAKERESTGQDSTT